MSAIGGIGKLFNPWNQWIDSVAPAYLKGRLGPGELLMEGAFANFNYQSYNSAEGASKDYRPNKLEKLAAGANTVRDMALGLLLPWQLQIPLAAVTMTPMLAQAWTTNRQIQMRNWYRPNPAPLFRQRVVRMRQQGINDIGSGAGFIGNEARILAGRGF